MPSPEQPSGLHPKDHPPVPYFAASRFPTAPLAFATYVDVQQLIAENPCDLSAYRILLDQVSYVAVLGRRPAESLVSLVESLLQRGEPVTVPDEVRSALEARREQARQIGPWVEGHYRPGKRIRTDK